MSFLTPWYLLGALAIALPVMFHLIRRTTRHRTRFSSLMFLRTAPPRLTQRSRLEDRLLLALRALVLGLLTLGFARPFVKANAPADASAPPARTVVLLDTSASMQREGLWEEAQRRALAVVKAATPADQVAVILFDHRVRFLVRFEDGAALAPAERVALVGARLDDEKPGWGETRLDRALILAAEQVAGAAEGGRSGRREIVMITDLQRGSELAALQAFDWPDEVVTRVDVLEPRTAGNAGLQLVADRRALGSDLDPELRVRIRNSPDSPRDQFRVGWAADDDGILPGTVVEAYVPAAQSRVVSVPLPPAGQETHALRLQGDEAPFDDTLFVVPPKSVALNVIYFGTEPDSDPSLPLYFLRRAFPATPRLTVQLDAYPPDHPVSPDTLTRASLMVVTAALDEDVAQTLHAAVQAGGTLLFAPRRTGAVASLSILAGCGPLAVTEMSPDSYALIGEIDFRHPLLAPFATPAYSDFSGIHFWRYRRLQLEDLPSAQVLARFDNDDPALLDLPVGEGRLLVLTSCWHPDDSQLALSSKFVPLLYSLLDLAGADLGTSSRFRVGDSLSGDDGFTQLDQPGVYTAATSAVAVNIPASETRTEPMPIDELAQLGIPFAPADASPVKNAKRETRLAHTELEANQRLWRWLIAATLTAVGVETWLAGRTARRTTPPGGAAA